MSSFRRRRLRKLVFPTLFALSAAVVFGQSPLRSGEADPAVRVPAHSATRVLVKLRREVADAYSALRLVTGGPGAVQQLDVRGVASGELLGTLRTWNVAEVRPIYAEPFGNPQLAQKLGLDQFFVAEVPRGTNPGALAVALRSHGSEIEDCAEVGVGTVAAILPDDTLFPQQLSLHSPTSTTRIQGGQEICNTLEDSDIDAPEAWEVFSGADNVILAIIDSGVFPHSEFAGRMVPGRNTVPGADPDDTSDQCVAGINGHGTHGTGIAAAAGNNQLGVAGIAWGVEIMPVRVLTGCFGSVTDWATGIVWAVDNGADVLNISLQAYNLSAINIALLQSSLDYAWAQGAVIVCAAGNGFGANSPPGAPPGTGSVAFPARLEPCLAVSGIDACDRLAVTPIAGWVSNWGPEVDVCAPGDDIWSTLRNDTFGQAAGTSMATSHVSGVAALVRSFAPDLTNAEVVAILKGTAVDLVDSPGSVGWDPYFGHGRVNAHLALLGTNPTLGACCDTNDTAGGDPAGCTDGVAQFECDAPDDVWTQGAPCSSLPSCKCVADCTDAECGDDGCGGSCGSCDDGNQCTVDNCDPTKACTRVANDALCNDNQFCNGVEICDTTLGCQPGTAPNCDDGIGCTVDLCDEVTDSCAHAPSDALCSDGLFCNGIESCGASGCLPGTPPCASATEFCDEAEGACLRSPIPTVSMWGMVVMTLVLLVAAKVRFGRHASLT